VWVAIRLLSVVVATVSVLQPRLLTVPVVSLMPLSMVDANRLLTKWGHRLGAVNRPFRQEAYAIELHGEPISVATSGSIVSPTAGGYRCQEVVELTRLCTHPDYRRSTRVMIRFWREVCAPTWPCWPVVAAVSYSQNAHYRGNVYRTDGWTRVSTECGKSTGGGTWSRKRDPTDAAYGSKSLWVWRYEAVQS